MKKIFLTLAITFFSSSVFAAPIESPLDKLFKYFKDGQMIKIDSFNAKNYMEIKDGTYKKSPLEIDAFIAYPKKGETRTFSVTDRGPRTVELKILNLGKKTNKLCEI